MTEVVGVAVAVQPVARAQLALDGRERREETRVVRREQAELRQQ